MRTRRTQSDKQRENSRANTQRHSTDYRTASSFDQLWDSISGTSKAAAAQRRQDRASCPQSKDRGRPPARGLFGTSSRALSIGSFRESPARRSSSGHRATSLASQQATQSRVMELTPAAAVPAGSMRCNAMIGPEASHCPFYTNFTGAANVRQLDQHHLKVHYQHQE